MGFDNGEGLDDGLGLGFKRWTNSPAKFKFNSNINIKIRIGLGLSLGHGRIRAGVWWTKGLGYGR
eukprot:1239859-Amorphochlora_amoeboformis.AAC.1